MGVTLETGGHSVDTFVRSERIIVSPGVPLDLAPLAAAKEKGIPVTGEMDLAVQVMNTPIVAVTGTNGKSTVTAFLGALLQNAGHKVFVGGNLGTPLIDYAAAGSKADVAVVEVSSFQLDTMEGFSPLVALLLNISPDHLDRYPNYEAYVQSKLKIFKNQGAGDFAILNDEASDDVQGQTAAQYLFVVEELLTDRQGQPVTIQVTLPVDADQPGVLREDLELPALGLPRDLDGDGEIDGSNHAAAL